MAGEISSARSMVPNSCSTGLPGTASKTSLIVHFIPQRLIQPTTLHTLSGDPPESIRKPLEAELRTGQSQEILGLEMKTQARAEAENVLVVVDAVFERGCHVVRFNEPEGQAPMGV